MSEEIGGIGSDPSSSTIWWLLLSSAAALVPSGGVGEYAGAGEVGSCSGDTGDVGAPHFAIGGALPTAVVAVAVVAPDSDIGGTLPLPLAEYPAVDGP